MGDVTLNLTVRKKDKAAVEALISREYEDSKQYENCINLANKSGEPELVSFYFSELKNQSIEIENELESKLIPYDKEWDAGLETEAGSEYFRITEELKPTLKSFKKSNKNMVNLADVIKSFELDRMEEYIEEMKADLAPISWTEQDVILKAIEAYKVTLKI